MFSITARFSISFLLIAGSLMTSCSTSKTNLQFENDDIRVTFSENKLTTVQPETGVCYDIIGIELLNKTSDTVVVECRTNYLLVERIAQKQGGHWIKNIGDNWASVFELRIAPVDSVKLLLSLDARADSVLINIPYYVHGDRKGLSILTNTD